MHFIATLNRTAALVQKEGLQVIRDPSALLIAFVLPVLMLFLFAYAVSLDLERFDIGVVVPDDSRAARDLLTHLEGSSYFSITPARSMQELDGKLVSGELKGILVIEPDLDVTRLQSAGANLQLLTDASQPNTANFVAAYTQGAIASWLATQPQAPGARVDLRSRFWFNPEIDSRRFLIPGAIGIIMTMIGTLLTALVVAREWERGTMEALLSTPARVNEILLGKLLPYFLLGLLASLIAALLSVLVFAVPLRGSLGALLLLSGVFMIPALGQGLMISVIAKNQFIASQMALISGFLPAFLLSGFLFEIDSMPTVIRYITTVVPAKYYISSLQTIFLVGDVWTALLPNMIYLALLGLFFLGVARVRTKRSLEA